MRRVAKAPRVVDGQPRSSRPPRPLNRRLAHSAHPALARASGPRRVASAPPRAACTCRTMDSQSVAARGVCTTTPRSSGSGWALSPGSMTHSAKSPLPAIGQYPTETRARRAKGKVRGRRAHRVLAAFHVSHYGSAARVELWIKLRAPSQHQRERVTTRLCGEIKAVSHNR